MLRKFSISALLFPILLALTVPVGSQTRPRRVEPPANDAQALIAETRAPERPRVVRERPTEIREGAPPKQSVWPLLLRGSLIAIAASRAGHGGACSPSRGVLIGGPRFTSPGSAR